MKRMLLTVMSLAVLSTACVPAYPMRSFPDRYGRYPGPGYDPGRFVPAPSPAGRWDNVMMLAAGTPIQVLLMNGGQATGQITSASSDALRLQTASGDRAISAADVMRVDRVLSDKVTGAVREGAKGAAVGAGAVGVLGLIVGRMPPPRVFLAGAAIGGYNQLALAPTDRGAVTIYVAAAAAPVRPGTPLSRRQEPE
ncbi:MAG: hypothetical protein ABJC89_21680 [Acidobacteriota bacterium]